MAVDKLVDSAQLDSGLTSIANSIRSKFGTNGSLLFPSGFVSTIDNITSRSSSDLTVSGTTITAPAGYYAEAASKTVSAPEIESLTVTPTESQQVFNGSTQGNEVANVGFRNSGTRTISPSLTVGNTYFWKVEEYSDDGYVLHYTTSGTFTCASSEQNVYDYLYISSSSIRSTTNNVEFLKVYVYEEATVIDGYLPVTVNAVSSSYIGSGITRRSSSDLTASGATVTAPAGYYASSASKSVASGSVILPSVSETIQPTISVDSDGLITASASKSKTINPTVRPGYVTSVSSCTVSFDGSNTKQLSTQGGTTITPTESVQTAVASGRYTTGAVKVGAISSTYVGSGITQRDSTDLTVSGATVTAPAGYYAEVASTSVASGSAGTPTATKGTVSNHSISVTPSVTNTTGFITGSTINGTPVTVDVTELESGTKTITENGTGISVSGYSSVDVNVSGSSVSVEPLSVTQNGTYTAPTGKAYSPVSVNVSGGDTPPVEEKDVNFIDYDGTVLYSYTAAEAQALTELPANPSHARLTAQGWNWTLSQIKSQLTSTPGQAVWVGQMYTTESGATEIDIELDNQDYLSPYLTIAVKGTVSIDWGDGTTSSTVTGNSLTTLKYTLHEYAALGNYTIKISEVSDSFAFSNTSNVKAGLLSVYAVESNRRYNRAYAETVKRIFIGNDASIGNNAFTNCYALQSITIPSSVTSIGNNALQNCYALQSITIPSSVTSIGSSSFYGCYALQSIAIPSSVTSIGNSAFYNCYALQSITIPSSVTSIWNNVFTNCCALQSITIPSSVTSIGTYAFYNCYILQSITIPSSVTSIGNSAFYNCYALQSITIPSSVTSIGNNALQSCYALQSITIPSSVTSIGSSAFYTCYGVEEYHITPTTPPTLEKTNAFNGIVSGTIIYVPSESLEAYKTATNWSTYASYMQGE